MVAVLAAGQSRRFGPGDKLVAPFAGKPMGLHVTDTLNRSQLEPGFAKSIVVAAEDDHPCARGWQKAGFAVVRNPNAAEGLGTSVAVAARIARRAEFDHLLVALADMPLVPTPHYAALVDEAVGRGPTAIVASSDGRSRMPPAVFGRDHFDALAEFSADTGARSLLAKGQQIECPPEWLSDIDTPEQLTRLDHWA